MKRSRSNSRTSKKYKKDKEIDDLVNSFSKLSIKEDPIQDYMMQDVDQDELELGDLFQKMAPGKRCVCLTLKGIRCKNSVPPSYKGDKCSIHKKSKCNKTLTL